MADSKTLITFIGRQDPFNKDGKDGPLLTLLARHDTPFEQIILIHTPEDEFTKNTNATKTEIQKRYSKVDIITAKLELKDPTNHVDVFKTLKRLMKDIINECKAHNLFISLTSGTPQMHISAFLLVASGELSATMLYMPDPREQEGVIRKIITWDGEMPEILPRFPKGTMSELIKEDIEQAKAKLGIVGKSDLLNQAVNKALRYAPHDKTVMIRGATGTGKESIAKLIHQYSKRGDKPFFAFNCAAITETIAESELFGHTKGAFTGATNDKKGYFTVVNGGTLFLDEVGDLPLSIQAKLLRVLETKEIYPVGASKHEEVSVRIICATHRDLELMVEEGSFREDLYYRLNELRIDMPSLRDRQGDIPELAIYFLNQFNHENEVKKSLTDTALHKLCKHSWRGNIRELKTFIWRVAIDCPDEIIDYKDIDLPNERYEAIINSLPAKPFEGFSLEKVINEIREYYYEKALEETKGNKSRASKLLDVSPQAVDKWLKREQ